MTHSSNFQLSQIPSEHARTVTTLLLSPPNATMVAADAAADAEASSGVCTESIGTVEVKEEASAVEVAAALSPVAAAAAVPVVAGFGGRSASRST